MQHFGGVGFKCNCWWVGNFTECVVILQGSVAILQGSVAILQGSVVILQDSVAILQGSVAILQDSVAILQKGLVILLGGVMILHEGVVMILPTNMENVPINSRCKWVYWYMYYCTDDHILYRKRW